MKDNFLKKSILRIVLIIKIQIRIDYFYIIFNFGHIRVESILLQV